MLTALWTNITRSLFLALSIRVFLVLCCVVLCCPVHRAAELLSFAWFGLCLLPDNRTGIKIRKDKSSLI